MNRRMKKKVHNREVDERLDALEELTRRMAAEQTAQRERNEELSENLHLFQEAHARRHAVEDQRRRRQTRIHLERERERRQARRELAKCFAVLAVAIAFLLFALMLPTPVEAEPIMTAEPVAVAVTPAEGVMEAVAMSQNDNISRMYKQCQKLREEALRCRKALPAGHPCNDYERLRQAADYLSGYCAIRKCDGCPLAVACRGTGMPLPKLLDCVAEVVEKPALVAEFASKR